MNELEIPLVCPLGMSTEKGAGSGRGMARRGSRLELKFRAPRAV